MGNGASAVASRIKMTMFVDVPQQHVGLLVGPQGSTIIGVQRQSLTRIVSPPRGAPLNEDGTLSFQIRGPPANVFQAYHLMRDILPADMPFAAAELELTSHSHAQCLAPHVKTLFEETGANVLIPNPKRRSKFIAIEGSPECVEACLGRIQEHIVAQMDAERAERDARRAAQAEAAAASRAAAAQQEARKWDKPRQPRFATEDSLLDARQELEEHVRVNPDRLGLIFGRNHSTLQNIRLQSGADVEVDSERSVVHIHAMSQRSMNIARDMLRGIAGKPPKALEHRVLFVEGVDSPDVKVVFVEVPRSHAWYHKNKRSNSPLYVIRAWEDPQPQTDEAVDTTATAATATTADVGDGDNEKPSITATTAAAVASASPSGVDEEANGKGNNGDTGDDRDADDDDDDEVDDADVAETGDNDGDEEEDGDNDDDDDDDEEEEEDGDDEQESPKKSHDDRFVRLNPEPIEVIAVLRPALQSAKGRALHNMDARVGSMVFNKVPRHAIGKPLRLGRVCRMIYKREVAYTFETKLDRRQMTKAKTNVAALPIQQHLQTCRVTLHAESPEQQAQQQQQQQHGQHPSYHHNQSYHRNPSQGPPETLALVYECDKRAGGRRGGRGSRGGRTSAPVTLSTTCKQFYNVFVADFLWVGPVDSATSDVRLSVRMVDAVDVAGLEFQQVEAYARMDGRGIVDLKPARLTQANAVAQRTAKSVRRFAASPDADVDTFVQLSEITGGDRRGSRRHNAKIGAGAVCVGAQGIQEVLDLRLDRVLDAMWAAEDEQRAAAQEAQAAAEAQAEAASGDVRVSGDGGDTAVSDVQTHATGDVGDAQHVTGGKGKADDDDDNDEEGVDDGKGDEEAVEEEEEEEDETVVTMSFTDLVVDSGPESVWEVQPLLDAVPHMLSSVRDVRTGLGTKIPVVVGRRPLQTHLQHQQQPQQRHPHPRRGRTGRGNSRYNRRE